MEITDKTHLPPSFEYLKTFYIFHHNQRSHMYNVYIKLSSNR